MSKAVEVETRRGRPDFLKMVGDLAVLARGGIENLRTHVHPSGYSFRDTLPRTLPENEAIGLEEAVRWYLDETKAEEVALKELHRGTNGIKPSDSIERNTARYAPEANAWEAYYKTLGLVEWQNELFVRDTDNGLGGILDNIAAEIGRGSKQVEGVAQRLRLRIARKLGDKFYGLMDDIQQEIYAGLPDTIRENPERLYGLCFNALAEIDYSGLTGKDLENRLDQEKVPIVLFERYTGRNLSEEERSKVPARVVEQPIVEVQTSAMVRPAISGETPNGSEVYAPLNDSITGPRIKMGKISYARTIIKEIFEALWRGPPDGYG